LANQRKGDNEKATIAAAAGDGHELEMDCGTTGYGIMDVSVQFARGTQQRATQETWQTEKWEPFKSRLLLLRCLIALKTYEILAC